MNYPRNAPRNFKTIGSFLLLLLLATGIYAEVPTKPASVLSKRIAVVPSGPAATIAYCEGTVSINGVPADIGSIVPDQATVRTGPDSLAEIVFESKNAIRMGAKTTILYQLQTLAKNVDLQQGSLTAVLHKLDRASGGSLTLKTPTAVGGVRGTSFFASVEPDTGKTYLCICDGRIQLSDNQGNNPFEKAAAHHGGTYFSKTAKGVEITPAGMEQHSDADVESLASRIGETVDWGSIESYN